MIPPLWELIMSISTFFLILVYVIAAGPILWVDNAVLIVMTITTIIFLFLDK